MATDNMSLREPTTKGYERTGRQIERVHEFTLWVELHCIYICLMQLVRGTHLKISLDVCFVC